MKKIIIIGHGFCGLTTAVLLTMRGQPVETLGIASEAASIITETSKHSQVPELKDTLIHVIANKTLRFIDNLHPADVFIISAPATIAQTGIDPLIDQPITRADCSPLFYAAKGILSRLQPGNIVILESKASPRTTIDLLQPLLEQTGIKAGVDFFLAYCPQRCNPSNTLQELTHTDIIIGGINQASARAASTVYQTYMLGQMHITNSTTAELVHLAQSSYIDINIAFAREFSRISERYGVDPLTAADLANRNPAVNLQPRLSLACYPEQNSETLLLVPGSPHDTRLLQTARAINNTPNTRP